MKPLSHCGAPRAAQPAASPPLAGADPPRDVSHFGGGDAIDIAAAVLRGYAIQ
jgi:hypothetical protein